MVFSGSPFLFYFLPAVLALYFLVPRRLKNPVLLVFSLFFYAWGEPVYILLMIFSIVMDYALGRWLYVYKEKGNMKAAKRVLVLSVVLNLALLGFFKYTNFLLGTIGSLFHVDVAQLYPLGRWYGCAGLYYGHHPLGYGPLHSHPARGNAHAWHRSSVCDREGSH